MVPLDKQAVSFGQRYVVANKAGLALRENTLRQASFVPVFLKVEHGIGTGARPHVIAANFIIPQPPYHFFIGNAEAPG